MIPSQSGKSSLMSWPDVKLIPQTKKCLIYAVKACTQWANLPSANSVVGEILNVFDTDSQLIVHNSWPIIMDSPTTIPYPQVCRR